MISVVIPSLNERENLARLIPGIVGVLGGDLNEVIVVDGHSTDGTPELVKEFHGSDARVKLLVQSGKGFANALVEGLCAAAGDVIVTMDAENHLPEEIPLLVKTLNERGAGVAVGSRFLKESRVDLEAKRFISSRLGNEIAKAALKLNVNDCSSGFRAYRASVVKPVLGGLQTEYFSIQVELLERINELGAHIAEVPVTYVGRESGDSKFKLTPALKDATKLLKIAKDQRIGELRQKSEESGKRIKSKIEEIKKKGRK